MYSYAVAITFLRMLFAGLLMVKVCYQWRYSLGLVDKLLLLIFSKNSDC